MIKIFNSEDRDFSSCGNIIINPIKCHETKKKSLNGWYIDVELSTTYKEYIEKDKLCVVQTKSKLNPQAFRIGENIEYSTKKIRFRAYHVMFDAKDYILVDVRPTNLNGLNALNYVNDRTDISSPYTIHSNVEHLDTAYFIRKNLLEAWETIEERWGGIFDADNWNINFYSTIGNDNGASVIYGKNMQGFEIYEDWSSVCSRIYPVGYNGLMLPEKYIESNIQYTKPYTRVIDFNTDLDEEARTEEQLISELRRKANAYINENKYPKVSYTIKSDIDQNLEIGDTIRVLHPYVELYTEVLEYEYNIVSKKIISLTFGNYSRDVQAKFINIKNTINAITQEVNKQEAVINAQTILINSLNKNGYVYIDDNEILILDRLPIEEAQNVWRFGMGGIGFSSNGYEGPFDTAMTMDGRINADFITTGTLSVSRIEGLANQISEYNQQIANINIELGKIESSISDLADITTSQDTNTGRLVFDNVNESEPVRVEIKPLGDNISYLYPFELLYPDNDLYIKLRTLRFTNTKTNEVFDYELPDDLLYYDSENFDEFILDYDSQTCKIKKKCAYDNNGQVVLLSQERVDEYTFPEINLTDGDYKVEILKYSNVPYVSYLFCRLMNKNAYTDQFPTRLEMRSKIAALANEIALELLEKVDGRNYTAAEILLRINNDESQAKIKADKISLEGKTIDVTGEDVNITGENIDISSEGRVNLRNDDGDSPALTIEGMGLSPYDCHNSVHADGMDVNTLDNKAHIYLGIVKEYPVGGDERPAPLFNLYNDDYDDLSVSCDVFQMSDKNANITTIKASGIKTPVLTQTSRQENKKNFEIFGNAIEKLKAIDIYKYNLKSEDDKTKKHIGFVIGDKYKYSEEVTSADNSGVDLYSFVSLCCQAIKEQQEEIEELKQRLEETQND